MKSGNKRNNSKAVFAHENWLLSYTKGFAVVQDEVLLSRII